MKFKERVNRFFNNDPIKPTNNDNNNQSFSLDYNYGDGDLSKPEINERFYGQGGYVPFGNDNLYPEKIDSLYVSSSAHSSIVNFKLNSLLGGGWDLKDFDNISDTEYKDFKKFTIKNDFDNLLEECFKDYINSGRTYILLTYSKDRKSYIKSQPLPASSVRNNRKTTFKDITKYFISEDWQYIESILEATPYSPSNTDKYQILECSNKVNGVKSYGLPDWIGAANWVFVDTDLAYLNKQNLVNLVEPSAIINYPYQPTPEGQRRIKEQFENKAKGSKDAKRKWVFFNDDQNPTIDFPSISNDTSAFEGTDKMMKENISIAHQVNPILIGVQYAGKLGATSEIEMAWDLFRQNWLIRNKNKLERFINYYIEIMGINHTFYLKDYSIVSSLSSEDYSEESKTVMDIVDALEPSMADKMIDSLTINEKRKLLGLKPLVGGNKVDPTGVISPDSSTGDTNKNKPQ